MFFRGMMLLCSLNARLWRPVVFPAKHIGPRMFEATMHIRTFTTLASPLPTLKAICFNLRYYSILTVIISTIIKLV